MTYDYEGECVGVPYYGSDSAAETNLDIHRRSSWSTTVDDVIVEDSVCLCCSCMLCGKDIGGSFLTRLIVTRGSDLAGGVLADSTWHRFGGEDKLPRADSTHRSYLFLHVASFFGGRLGILIWRET